MRPTAAARLFGECRKNIKKGRVVTIAGGDATENDKAKKPCCAHSAHLVR
jgi:hypothetical protein